MMDWNQIGKVVQSSWQMRVNPGEPRVIHVDIGLTGDCAGIACGHRYDYYTKAHHDPVTGQVVEKFAPKVWIDFMLQIKPTHGSQIDLTRIVAFILNLRNYGVPIVKVTFDGFQSAHAIQILQKSGQLVTKGQAGRANKLTTELVHKLGAGKISVDRNDIAYTLLRDALAYNAINFYRYQPFIDELVALEHNLDKRKVDHPPGGRKDVSDAVAGVVFNCATLDIPIQQETRLEGLQQRRLLGTSLEQQMMGAVTPVYPEGRIVGMDPPPAATPSPVTAKGDPAVEVRSTLSSGTQEMLYRLAQFGRFD
jgi:hypothetical protein